MKKSLRFLPLLAILFLVGSCKPNQPKATAENKDTQQIDKKNIIQDCSVLTAEQQASLTPEKVIEYLKKGNESFASGDITARNNTARIREAAAGQHPSAVILSCLDSRVPVEDVFQRGIGDLFVGRVAGNTVNPEMLGSLEFACKVAGAKAIVVMGHNKCGAVVNAIDDVKLGNITAMLAKIRPAVKSAGTNFKGEKKSSNPDFEDVVCRENIKMTINEIRAKSPILKEMEKKGEITIVGAAYDLNTGKVNFL